MALISAIGMSIFLQNWVALGQGARDMAVPSLVSGAVQFHMGSDFDVTVPYSRIMIILVTVALMVGLTLFIKYSAWAAPRAPARRTCTWPTCWASTPTA